MLRPVCIACLSCLLLWWCGCRQAPAEEHPPFYFDFEHDVELGQAKWECHQALALSAEFATHGDSSLKLELYPSHPSPGLKLVDFDLDWSGHESFHFDAFNPQNTSLCLQVLIDDQDYHGEYADRFEARFVLPPGRSHHLLPLDRLVTSGTKRHLNLKSIEKVYLLLPELVAKTPLYFDYLHLQK